MISFTIRESPGEKVALTVKSQSDKSSDPDQQRTKHLCALPWIDRPSPRESNEEKYHAGCEEEDAAVVQFSHLLALGLALHMELSVTWWVIHELIQHEGDDGQNDA